MKKRILALDQASHTSGYAVFEEDKLITYGKFSFNDVDIGVRLQKIRNAVEKLLKDYEIDQVVMEDIQLQSNIANNVKTFKILAEVFGVIYELITEKEIPIEAVLASTWKSTLNIKGANRTAQKQNAQKWVASIYKVNPTQDECDAICIGAHYTTGNKKTEYFDWS